MVLGFSGWFVGQRYGGFLLLRPLASNFFYFFLWAYPQKSQLFPIFAINGINFEA